MEDVRTIASDEDMFVRFAKHLGLTPGEAGRFTMTLPHLRSAFAKVVGVELGKARMLVSKLESELEEKQKQHRGYRS